MTGSRSRSRGRVRRPAQAAAVGLRVDGHPVQDWSAIAVGSAVEVLLPKGAGYWGRVDAKTADSAIVWVVGGGGTGRQMHCNSEGVRLRPEAGEIA